MDVFTKEKRSEVMSRIKGKDTVLKISFRKLLHKDGFRFRKNDKRYPGKPDIILPKFQTAIFINGCFWHGHSGCKYFIIPKTRTDFWVGKIRKTQENDSKNHSMMKEAGWKVIVLWECELEKNIEKKFNELKKTLTEKTLDIKTKRNLTRKK